ncbi:hypothetical protein PG987_011529 [Apiospora arundinis]
MILSRILSVAAWSPCVLAFNYGHEVSPDPDLAGGHWQEWPTCIDLVQYRTGRCCIADKPCPSPAGNEQTTITRSSAQDTSEFHHEPSPARPTMINTQAINHDGKPMDIVVIHGGPITSFITVTSGPQPTPLDPTGGPMRSSVSSLFSRLANDALPLASSWASDPSPP